MKLRRALLLGLVLSLVAGAVVAYAPRPTPAVRLYGSTDLDMLNTVHAELAAAREQHRHKVRFDLLSPGGGVFVALEIAREIRDAYDNDGITVEIHARTMCASGCTMVLSAGTPGYRYIHPTTMFLVHPIQTQAGCLDHPPVQVAVEDKVTVTVYAMFRDAYVRNTGQSVEVVEDWLICGHERVGRGMLAVDMHIADALDK